MVSDFYSLASNHACRVFSRCMVPLQFHSSRITIGNRFQFTKNMKCVPGDQNIARRSGNYKPTLWNDDYIQTIESVYSVHDTLSTHCLSIDQPEAIGYMGKVYAEMAAKLKKYVKQMIEDVDHLSDKLVLVNDLERLGVSYHFDDEIKSTLEKIYNGTDNNVWNNEDLLSTSLRFRILRQHGYNCPIDMFDNFKEGDNFKACLSKDVKGLLYLYDATFLSVEGERTLEKAREFSTKYLNESLEKKTIDANLAILISHSLELPLHWRMPRLEARWFIDVYRKRTDTDPKILEFAILDFNMVQAIHQEELKQMSRWWSSTRLGDKLSFARDRFVENYLWTVGMNFEPRSEYVRRMSTKIISLITTIDDIYDVYGTMEELELFTSAVESWDLSAMDQLPDYMKICYFALFNSTNEMAYDTFKEEGLVVISFLKKAWIDLCKSYLLEAKWYHTGYKPMLDEYLNNAWISVAVPVALLHVYVFVTKPLKKENLEFFEKYHNIIKLSSLNMRLSDDLGTSTDELKRGDVLKSIQCHMNDTGASEEDARKHINHLIEETWMDINEQIILLKESPLISNTFNAIAVNVCRMAQCVYQFGDGHASEGPKTQNRFMSFIINPIPLI